MRPDRKYREALLTRQNDKCLWCGFGLHYDQMHAHHRKLRAQGGTWDKSNVVGLHGMCHNLSDTGVHARPDKARRLGFVVPSWHDPVLIPLWNRALHEWWLFTDEGTAEPCTVAVANLRIFGDAL